MSERLYSVRMRASASDGTHISGAERLVPESEVESTKEELTARANNHERGTPDSIVINSEPINQTHLIKLNALPVSDNFFDNVEDASEFAAGILIKAGVPEKAARSAFGLIAGKPPILGGAVLVNSETGEVITQNSPRVRIMDYDAGSLPELTVFLEENRLSGTHFREALALATKVAHAPGIVAELCVSDDPSYVTGYVASRSTGYVRITPVKQAGDYGGGRVWFIDPKGLDEGALMEYVRSVPVLVTGPFEKN